MTSVIKKNIDLSKIDKYSRIGLEIEICIKEEKYKKLGYNEDNFPHQSIYRFDNRNEHPFTAGLPRNDLDTNLTDIILTQDQTCECPEGFINAEIISPKMDFKEIPFYLNFLKTKVFNNTEDFLQGKTCGVHVHWSNSECIKDKKDLEYLFTFFKLIQNLREQLDFKIINKHFSGREFFYGDLYTDFFLYFWIETGDKSFLKPFRYKIENYRNKSLSDITHEINMLEKDVYSLSKNINTKEKRLEFLEGYLEENIDLCNIVYHFVLSNFKVFNEDLQNSNDEELNKLLNMELEEKNKIFKEKLDEALDENINTRFILEKLIFYFNFYITLIDNPRELQQFYREEDYFALQTYQNSGIKYETFRESLKELYDYTTNVYTNENHKDIKLRFKKFWDTFNAFLYYEINMDETFFINLHKLHPHLVNKEKRLITRLKKHTEKDIFDLIQFSYNKLPELSFYNIRDNFHMEFRMFSLDALLFDKKGISGNDIVNELTKFILYTESFMMNISRILNKVYRRGKIRQDMINLLEKNLLWKDYNTPSQKRKILKELFSMVHIESLFKKKQLSINSKNSIKYHKRKSNKSRMGIMDTPGISIRGKAPKKYGNITQKTPRKKSKRGKKSRRNTEKYSPIDNISNIEE
tara:strand:- start:3140 stop:5050 length:1911 start_codon:yes stop_codon:yes gene_type:complete